jgi:hypothetical protein
VQPKYPEKSLPDNRSRDLLPIIRGFVSHPAFLGSYSIKSLAPALVPGCTYDDLDGVANGTDVYVGHYRHVLVRDPSGYSRSAARCSNLETLRPHGKLSFIL